LGQIKPQKLASGEKNDRKSDQINFSDIETFLADACGDESVVAAFPETANDLDLLLLRQTLLA
jgi:hypothetical protein